MLCVWWDQKGIIYYYLLEPKQTVNAKLYSHQLINLSQALQEKWPYSGKGKRKVIFLLDNVRPHAAKTTRATIESLGWEALPNPAYLLDMAPSDYHLFRSMEHLLRRKSFVDFESIKKEISMYFAYKPASFYVKGIQFLPERWEKIIASDNIT